MLNRMTDVDRSQPIPPSEQPARLAALVAAVRARTDLVPRVGMVLGSGLGSLADDLEDPVSIPFEELPGWPVATAPGHAGRLLLGRLAGVPVAVLQGRFHLYEGNDPGLVVQPVLLFKQLGARARDPDQRRRRREPGLWPRDADDHQRPHQPHRA